MKKEKNDTWLGFFKKTLKVTGLTIVGITIIFIGIVIWLIYNEKNYSKGPTKSDLIGTVYLNCENKFIAFNDIYMRSQWDGLEKDWEISLDITKINKRVVEAKFNFDGGEGIYTIDRINGTIELKNLTEDKILAKRNCIKIEKTDLPDSKETPKF